MKKVSFRFSLLILSLFGLSLSSCEDDRVVPASELPASATAFIERHYPNELVLQIIQDFDESRLSREYYVTLKNLTRLEFNHRGEITEIDGKTPIPTGAIASSLIDKATELFPSAQSIGWELERNSQDLQLSNQVTLEFTREGQFLRIDD